MGRLTHAFAASMIAGLRARLARQYIPFLVGAIHILLKVRSGNNFAALSKLRKSFSEETIATTIVEHFRVIRVLDRSGAAALTQRYPHYVNKYVHKYLMKSFGKKTRREILKFHYQYLARHVTDSFCEQVLQGRSILWREMIDENWYAISMSLNPHHHAAGDLLLAFEMNDTAIYEISFTIVPGSAISSTAEQVLLVARIQGRKDKAEGIGIATRACHRIAPAHLLMAAAQSIAAALAIDTIGGVTNKEQITKPCEGVSNVFFDYDAFWETFILKQSSASVYEMQVPFPERPGAKASHRSKARLERRQYKNRVSASVGAAFAKNFIKRVNELSDMNCQDQPRL
jgi:uncharacterized protein VirK/YbjX